MFKNFIHNFKNFWTALTYMSVLIIDLNKMSEKIHLKSKITEQNLKIF